MGRGGLRGPGCGPRGCLGGYCIAISLPQRPARLPGGLAPSLPWQQGGGAEQRHRCCSGRGRRRDLHGAASERRGEWQLLGGPVLWVRPAWEQGQPARGRRLPFWNGPFKQMPQRTWRHRQRPPLLRRPRRPRRPAAVAVLMSSRRCGAAVRLPEAQAMARAGGLLIMAPHLLGVLAGRLPASPPACTAWHTPCRRRRCPPCLDCAPTNQKLFQVTKMCMQVGVSREQSGGQRFKVRFKVSRIGGFNCWRGCWLLPAPAGLCRCDSSAVVIAMSPCAASVAQPAEAKPVPAGEAPGAAGTSTGSSTWSITWAMPCSSAESGRRRWHSGWWESAAAAGRSMQRPCKQRRPCGHASPHPQKNSIKAHPANRNVRHQHASGGASALEAQPAAAGPAAVHGQQQWLALRGQRREREQRRASQLPMTTALREERLACWPPCLPARCVPWSAAAAPRTAHWSCGAAGRAELGAGLLRQEVQDAVHSMHSNGDWHGHRAGRALAAQAAAALPPSSSARSIG